MNRRRGYVYKEEGCWIARLTFTDASGKRRNIKRRAANKSAANDALKEIIRKLDQQGEKAIDGDLLLFRELSKMDRERHVFPAEYRGERKVAGLRSYIPIQIYLDVLTAYFGGSRVRDINPTDVQRFQLERLKTPTQGGRERSLTSVNRELEVLRAVFNFARRQGWIARTPFESGAILISKAHEVQRERILTRDEEERLLMACTGWRAHLRPLLICALDTAMRRGEMFGLRWSDVDFDTGLIRIRATTTKTLKQRTVGLTSRLKAELWALWEKATDENALVFGLTNNCRSSFKAVCRAAGIEGLRLHDLRHCAITRMIQAAMPIPEVMKISGHTEMSTFLRYVNANEQTAQRAAQALDGLYANQSLQNVVVH